MGKTDTVTEAMGRDELKRLFRLAREQPVSAALALDKSGVALLLLDKRKPDTALERQLRADAPAATLNRRGTVMIDPDDDKLAVFTVNKPAPGMARKLVKTLKGTGISRVRFRLEDGTLCDDADGDAPEDPQSGAQPAPSPNLDPDAVKARLVEQVNRIAPALAADPSRRDELLSLATQGRDHLAAGDLDAAESDIAALERALDQPAAPGDSTGKWPRMLPPEPDPDAAPPLTLVGYTPGAPGQAPGGPKPKPAPVQMKAFKAFIPKNTATLDAMFRIFEVVAWGRVTNSKWDCNGYCDMAKNQGKVIPFQVPAASVAANRDPAAAKRAHDDKSALNGLPGPQKTALETEAARRYVKTSGELPGPDAHQAGNGQADVYDRAVSSVMQDRELLKSLPPEVAALLGGKSGEYDPKHYTQLLRIVDKLKSFSPEDLKLYKTLPIKATDNLDVFEKSLDVFLQRKAELLEAIQDQQNAQPAPPDPVAAVWNDFDGTKLATMSEDDRETLARQKANEVAEAQLKQLADHPGDALKGLAKSATLMNTGETMDAIGKDIAEAADGDANAYARWGAGAGAGAKLSGWLLAVAGVVYVASWLTGVGELATIGAAAGYALGAMMTLSVAEEELRIKAASKETDPAKYKHDVEAAGQARLTIALTVATLVAAAVLHFTAKALFPTQVAKLKVTLKNFRDRLAKGPVAPLKPPLLQELAAHKVEFAKSGALAKASALDTARTLEALSTEDFVKRLQSEGGGGFLDHGKLPPEQKVDFAELMKSAEGRKAIETYKAKLVKTLRTDVTGEIDRLIAEYTKGLDDAVKAVDAATSHDDLAAATKTLEDLLGEDHAKQFMQNEHDQLVKQKLLEGAADAHKEIQQAPATGAAKRIQQRIASNPKFKLTYTTDEIMTLLAKAKQLGLPDKMIDDLIMTGSREAKRLDAAELAKQMDDWANNVSKRGFPHKFADLDEFKQFGTDLKGELAKGGIPVDDVRVQGSSLRTPNAQDVDLAVVIDQAGFDKLLIDRYDGKIAFSNKAPAPNTGTKISLAGKSHADLQALATDIESNPTHYNSTSKTFMNAELNGQLNSKGDISAGLKAAAKTIIAKYPQLNIETISIEVKGGAFDLDPALTIPTK